MDVTNTNVHLFFIYLDGRKLKQARSAYEIRKWLLRYAKKRRSKNINLVSFDYIEFSTRPWLAENPEYLYKYLPVDMIVCYNDKQWKAQDFWSRTETGV
jgi:hypothetical protein